MGLPESTESAREGTRPTTVTLSPWNQVGARVYFSPAHCYPLDNSKSSEAIDKVREFLDILALARPETAGRISPVQSPTQKGMVALTMDPDNDRIPLDVLNEEDTFGQTYEELKAKGFPPSAFVHPRFFYEGKLHNEDATLPTFRVLAVVIKGGLILSYYFHHSVFDGCCMKAIYGCLESIARGKVPAAKPSQDMSFISYDPIKNDGDLARVDPAKFPELDLPQFLELPREARGPQAADFDLQGTGKLFRFRNDKLWELRTLVKASDETRRPRVPSSYMCLAALTWAHLCKARSAAEVLKYRGTNPASAHLAAPPPPHMIVPVNWRGRVLFGRGAEEADYFGNASFGALATAGSSAQLLDACGDPSALAAVVRKIEADVAAQLSRGAVEARTALYARVGDVSRLGWRVDPLSAGDTVVNTWRFLGGADMCWAGVPGLLSERPEAVRRCAAAWSTGYACIMPGRVDSDFQDLLIMLPTAAAMEALCSDEGWMQWVDAVLE
ncbi:hypothetical protein RB595_009403 [Gaeumannomyces hyphopodioides]